MNERISKKTYFVVLEIAVAAIRSLHLCFFYQNGSLLRKYTYLSNDSSYSISIEDGVDIVVPGNLSSGDENSLDSMDQTSGSSLYSQSESYGTQSFTFETQVVCFRIYENNMHKAFNAARDLTCLLVVTIIFIGSLCMLMLLIKTCVHLFFAISFRSSKPRSSNR